MSARSSRRPALVAVACADVTLKRRLGLRQLDAERDPATRRQSEVLRVAARLEPEPALDLERRSRLAGARVDDPVRRQVSRHVLEPYQRARQELDEQVVRGG